MTNLKNLNTVFDEGVYILVYILEKKKKKKKGPGGLGTKKGDRSLISRLGRTNWSNRLQKRRSIMPAQRRHRSVNILRQYLRHEAGGLNNQNAVCRCDFCPVLADPGAAGNRSPPIPPGRDAITEFRRIA